MVELKRVEKILVSSPLPHPPPSLPSKKLKTKQTKKNGHPRENLTDENFFQNISTLAKLEKYMRIRRIGTNF